MSNPQQPELARSRKTPAQDADAVAGVLEGQRDPGAEAPRGPVPPENQPGHHPAEEQDKPDMKAFAEKLGTVEPSERESEPGPASVAGAGGQSSNPLSAVAGRRSIVAAVAALAAVLLAVVAGRRRRSRRRRG
jgi:hypothetical protein